MDMFTLEVAGRPVACIRAETRDKAQQLLDDPWFRDGLLGLEEAGQPVWGGDAEVHIAKPAPRN